MHRKHFFVPATGAPAGDYELYLLGLDWMPEAIQPCCASGECGACTVILADKAVCACLLPVGRVGEQNVETIESVGTPQSPHPLQRIMHEMGAFQCGFCTRGVVMSLIALLRQTPRPNDAQVRVALQGNVCRCSGYKKLLEAVAHFVEENR